MVKKLTKIQIYFLGLIFILVISVMLNNKEDTAYFLWETFRIPDIALVINKDAELSFDIGNYYFNAEGSGVYNQEVAREYFINTLKLDPGHKFARHQLARIQFLGGEFEEALKTINKQIELNGDSVIPSYYVRGLIYGFVGALDKAEDDFLVFIDAKPKNWGGYNDIAWIYFQKGEYMKAEKYSRLGLDLAPNNAWLLTTNGVSILNLYGRKEAREVLERALVAVESLTYEDWSNTNPGNDPDIAKSGLVQMIAIIESNLALVNN